ncbi:phosphoenolpyruvate mutase [Goodfellowiella coeruleoviolacea]|uniref:phosphoenolpyruvate mutase n=1 Tax=Goodfellowiella coeruleoviolacea TaxID=334858 RepID=A0AAE3KEX7_9PSEU|nr:phosphoenolpyruvate mutase [Goodfellowiella coeruleoviolacea]MCP2164300.1 phosphoenolpyruvate phosphomutase [Goodfellowiella coeruleoviolacea]
MDSTRPAQPPSRSARLRAMLAAPEISFLMEAHNGLSARIAQHAGFPGIWASGFAISTALGVRDSNELSTKELLDTVAFMVDATTVPIVVDGDTGYGNFNNARRLVRQLGRLGVSAVCLEDKLFPKTNSFLGTGQPLADEREFCGKIRACKDSQLDAEFCVVARVEALVSGRGLTEALHRAESYRRAGADAVFIHSKQQDGREVLDFAREWAGRCPLVITPTTYHGVGVDAFERAGVAMLIWANQNMRAAVLAMRQVCQSIAANRGLTAVEPALVSVQEVFDFLDYDELDAATLRYSSWHGDETTAGAGP